MKFKEWFNLWPDNVIQYGTFTCFGGPQKWHFQIDERINLDVTVESLRKDISNGWEPAEYEIDYIENMFINTSMDPTTVHFYICCKDSVKKENLNPGDKVKILRCKEYTRLVGKVAEVAFDQDSKGLVKVYFDSQRQGYFKEYDLAKI